MAQRTEVEVISKSFRSLANSNALISRCARRNLS